MGKLSLGSNSNSRLNKKVISGAILLLPLICPHRLKDFCQTHEAVDTPDQYTPQILEQEQAGVVNTPANRLIPTCAKGCQVLYACVMWSQICLQT